MSQKKGELTQAEIDESKSSLVLNTVEYCQKEVRVAFAIMDRNGSGRINVRELEKALQHAGENPTRKEVQQMIADNDLDGNGTLDIEEFRKMMEGKWKGFDDEDDYLRAFKMFDRNKDGSISAKELKKVMMNSGDKLTEEEAIAMFKEADINKDGQISYVEFVKMMKGEELTNQ